MLDPISSGLTFREFTISKALDAINQGAPVLRARLWRFVCLVPFLLYLVSERKYKKRVK